MGDVSPTAAAHQEPLLESAHVVFMDIVRYSMETIDQQTQLMDALGDIVRSAPGYQERAGETLVRLPTGDGMALVFFGPNPIRAVECARYIHRQTKQSGLELRIGVHTGPVLRRQDINANLNVAGGGINMAQRLMDIGDAGHLLVSSPVADVLREIQEWRPLLHDMGDVEVKHGVKMRAFNLWGAGVGNAAWPKRLSAIRTLFGDWATGTVLAWGLLIALLSSLLVLMRAAWFNLVPWDQFALRPWMYPVVPAAIAAAVCAALAAQYGRSRSSDGLLGLHVLVSDRAGRLNAIRIVAVLLVTVACLAGWWLTPPAIGVELVEAPIDEGKDAFNVIWKVEDPDYTRQTRSYYSITLYVGTLNPEGEYVAEIGLSPYGTDGGPEIGTVLIDKSLRVRLPDTPQFDDPQKRGFFRVPGAKSDFVGRHEIRIAGTHYAHKQPREATVDVSITVGGRVAHKTTHAIYPSAWHP